MTAVNSLKNRARRIVRDLAGLYPEASCALVYDGPLQLLVATILSAQCTDVRVNLVTPALFARYAAAAAFANADRAELERLIQSTGFFRNKARNIQLCCQQIVARHGGQVPSTMEELTPLAGVGRKTANVMLNTAFGQPTIAVDTHIFRISNRIGLAPGKTVEEVEKKLLKVVPDEFKLDAHHWLILHGRYVCQARKPQCSECIIRDLCEFKQKTV